MGLPFPGQRKRQIDDRTVLLAKQDDLVRENLIASHRKWLLKVVARICHRYVSEQDDEYSVAMLALNEAITAFQCQRGASFQTFAEQVIRRRLVDWGRKEKQRPEIVWSDLLTNDDAGSSEVQLTAHASLEAYRQEEDAGEQRYEIERLNRELRDYRISFADLVRVSPRHRDARQSAQRAAQTLAAHPDLLKKLLQSKSLPLIELQALVAISRKTLERQRKYIIALTLILSGDYPRIKAFIEWPEGGGVDGSEA